MDVSGEVRRDNKWPDPPWWVLARRILTFALGVAIIIDSLIEKNYSSIGKLVVGLLLIGIPPIEDIIKVIQRRE
jgi:hypothetical protein